MNKLNTRVDWTRAPAYATGDGSYARLHYPDGSERLVSHPLRVVLTRFVGLIRIHKQTAIDPAYVRGWKRDRASRSMHIWLHGGEVVEVGRRRIDEVLKQLKQPERA